MYQLIEDLLKSLHKKWIQTKTNNNYLAHIFLTQWRSQTYHVWPLTGSLHCCFVCLFTFLVTETTLVLVWFYDCSLKTISLSHFVDTATACNDFDNSEYFWYHFISTCYTNEWIMLSMTTMKMSVIKTFCPRQNLKQTFWFLIHTIRWANSDRGPCTAGTGAHGVQKLWVHKNLTTRSPEYGATADFFTTPHR